jgi:hypothetical protein
MFTIPILLAYPATTEAMTYTVTPAVSDPVYSPYQNEHAFVFGNNSFGATGTLIIHGDDATPLIPRRKHAEDVHFLFHFQSASPSLGSPKKELLDSAYLENGGPIDTSNWLYFVLVDGTLTGLGTGGDIPVNVSQRGPNFQLGYGANGKNSHLGFSGWLQSTAHFGDVNIDLTPAGGWSETPEPGTLLLVGVGFVFVGRQVRKSYAARV